MLPPASLFAVPPAFGLVGPLSAAPPPDPPLFPGPKPSPAAPPPPPPSEVMVENVVAEPLIPLASTPSVCAPPPPIVTVYEPGEVDIGKADSADVPGPPGATTDDLNPPAPPPPP